MPGLKQNRPFSSYFSQPQNQSSNRPFSQPQNQSSNSNIPRDNFFDPVQISEKSMRIQNIIQEIRQMNAIEIALLLQGINNLPNFRSYCNRLF
jgi:hypothetical protein